MAESTAIDFSPLWISLETASATIAIVFVLGVVAAWWVESRITSYTSRGLPVTISSVCFW